MSKDNNLHDFLQDVADAIREKKGSNDAINAQNFANEIKNLPSGGEVHTFGEDMVDNSGEGIRGIKTLLINSEEVVNLAYRGCTMNNLIIAEGCRKIGDEAFMYCLFYSSLELPSTLEEIGGGAFRENTFTSIVLPPSVKKIGSYCFGINNKMKRMTIKGVLQSFPAYAVSNCSLLASLILEGTEITPLANVNAFGNTPIARGTGYIYVPDDLVDAYKGATNWSTYASQIKGLSELPNE